MINNSYNKLYLVHRLYNGNNIYWTQTGNETDSSKKYRRDEQISRTNAEFDTIGVINCNSFSDAVRLQRRINEIFKPFMKQSSQSQIYIDMPLDKFVDCANFINHNRYSERLYDLLTYLNNKYNVNKCKGDLYFVKCANNKVKIGMTSYFPYRWSDLKKEIQNQAIDIIDVVKSEDKVGDEAKLQMLCHKYKEDGNKERRNCDSSRWLSELFTDCKEVYDIWYAFTKDMKHYNESYINELREST